MPSAPDSISRLIADFFMKRISEEEFLSGLGISKDQAPAFARDLLNRALAARDAEGVDNGIFLAYAFGYDAAFLELLNALATEPWHRKHEDIVFALGKIKDPSSVPVLARTAAAAFPYLEDDEAFALGVKSSYALKNIQTEAAVHVLRDIAKSGNEVLSAAAKGRLKDLAKNAASESVRSLAASLVAGAGG